MGTRVKSGSTETLDQLNDEVTFLKAALSEKESALRHLICTHEQLKATLKEEIAKLEADKKDLISSLDEANLIREEREGTVRMCKEEIEQLRVHLSESQKKCKQTEEWARSGKEAKYREELLMQFEEERNKVEDQLKWKCEQFAHLEEAHKKLQSEFREFKRDKEAEKLEFLDKISELQSVLDEKTHLAEDLRTRLEICNQVLAREESKRKLLEAELHESRDRYDNLITDFEAAKSAVESVTAKRDEDIASLRGILADKSLQIKEIEFEKAQIDQENRELRASLKEYREIEIGGVEKSKKFRALEKAHKGCGEKIKKREAEIENLKRDLDDKIARLHEKEQFVENLQNELKAKEKIGADDSKGDEVNNLQKRMEALLKEREILLCEHKGCGEKIEKRKTEIENLKRSLDDKIAQLHEKEQFVEKLQNELKAKEKIRPGEVDMKDSKGDEVNNLQKRMEALLEEREILLCEHKGCGEKIEKRKTEIENLKRSLDDKIAQLHEKEQFVEKLQNELKAKEKIRPGEVDMNDSKGDEVNNLQKRMEALLEEREILVCEHKGCGEKIEKRKTEIENLKRSLDDKIAQLHEKEQVVEKLQNELKAKEKIRPGEVDMNDSKGDEVNNLQKRMEALLEEREILLCEHKGCGEKIEKRKTEIENLKRSLDDKIAQLHEKEQFVEKLQNELKAKEKIRPGEVDMNDSKGDEVNNLQKRMEALLEEREILLCEHKGCDEKIEKRKAEIENLKGDLDDKIAQLHEKEQLVENLQNELKEKEKIRAGEVYMDDLKCAEVNNLQKREKALLEEMEMLLCELREKNDLVEQVKVCMGREKALVRENERLISEVREREGVIKQLKVERVKLLEKENDRLFREDEERKQVMKEHEECKERLDTLVKENGMLLGEVRQRDGIEEQLRECRDRGEALLREREMFIRETREKEGLIEELGGAIALSREHISRLESEIYSCEEEKRKSIEFRNEMAKKLLEIKFKLDPLEKKCTEVAKEKENEISGLEMNLELLIEELEGSILEKEELQLELQEMATSYYLQWHEIEFREGLFCDLEREMENLKINLRIKEDKFEAQLERERLENEVKRVRFSNDMKRLLREKENLALQMDHLNCSIGSLFSADREINAIVERIAQKMRNEDEHTYEKKSKLFVPSVGIRSPLKENNF